MGLKKSLTRLRIVPWGSPLVPNGRMLIDVMTYRVASIGSDPPLISTHRGYHPAIAGDRSIACNRHGSRPG